MPDYALDTLADDTLVLLRDGVAVAVITDPTRPDDLPGQTRLLVRGISTRLGLGSVGTVECSVAASSSLRLSEATSAAVAELLGLT